MIIILPHKCQSTTEETGAHSYCVFLRFPTCIENAQGHERDFCYEYSLCEGVGRNIETGQRQKMLYILSIILI